MATTGQEEFTLDTAAELAAEEGGSKIEGKSPWTLAARRLRRNYLALAFLGLFILVLVACLLAPVYSTHVSHVHPDDANAGGSITVHGKKVPVLSQGGSKFGAGGSVTVSMGMNSASSAPPIVSAVATRKRGTLAAAMRAARRSFHS